MSGPLRDSKVTDFFQRQPSLRIGNDSSLTSSQLSMPASPRSVITGNSSLPVVVAKRKPGRPKGSGKKKAKQIRDQPVLVSSDPSSRPGGNSEPGVPPLPSSGPSPHRSGNSVRSSKRQSRRPKKGRNKAENNNEEPCLLRSSPRAVLRGSRNIKENTSPQAFVPSKRKLDYDGDDDDITSITSSCVPLSLYWIPRQTSFPGSSKPPDPDGLSPPLTKKRRSLTSQVSHSLQAPVTPKRARAMEVIPTSQSSEDGLYTPIRPNIISQRRNDVQESVENWRRGRSAYRCNIVSAPRFSPGGDYSMEVDRPLSPLTSFPNTTSLGSPLSSFTDTDAIPLDVGLERPPTSFAVHSLPTPSSSSEGKHNSPIQIAKPLPVRPVTPPPSSPEQLSTLVPVAPKDSKVRTAEIITEIWANVRAKSVSDGEDSYLHAPIKDELSSEEEDDEPFWKRTKNPAW
jgi:hypothetical protein